MGIDKPYKRIYRGLNSTISESYLIDPLYSNDRISYIYSYHLIEKDLKVLFDYINPCNCNRKTYSHRIYELLFRCCTEFENNAKVILTSNNYTKNPDAMNICNDYFKINKALRLDDYEARLRLWEDDPLIIKPFEEWDSNSYKPLKWYQAYNEVKHNRSRNFNKANFESLIYAAAGLLIILYSQYAITSFNPYEHVSVYHDDDGFESANNSLFEIKPHSWSKEEEYNFKWNELKKTESPLNDFDFNS